MGDLGGLFDALVLLCRFIVGPISAFSMQATLLSSFFKFKPKVDDFAQSTGSALTSLQFFELFYHPVKTKEDSLAIAKTI